MKNLSNKQIISIGIGITVGSLISSYFLMGALDWNRSVAVGFMASILIYSYYKFLK